jgi:hypothetical protein
MNETIKEKIAIRGITFIAILGSLNGVFEIGMGTLLHLVKFPWAGSVMLLVNLTVYLLGRRLVPRIGTVFVLGFITALLKLLYAGGSTVAPAAAILLEAAIVEIILDILPMNVITATLTGGLSHTFTLIFPFLSFALLGGGNAIEMLMKLTLQGKTLFPQGGVAVVCLLFIVYFFIGCLWGYSAWQMSSLGVLHYSLLPGRGRAIPVFLGGSIDYKSEENTKS